MSRLKTILFSLLILLPLLWPLGLLTRNMTLSKFGYSHGLNLMVRPFTRFPTKNPQVSLTFEDGHIEKIDYFDHIDRYIGSRSLRLFMTTVVVFPYREVGMNIDSFFYRGFCNDGFFVSERYSKKVANFSVGWALEEHSGFIEATCDEN